MHLTGLSGITWLGDDEWAAVMDNSNRLITFSLRWPPMDSNWPSRICGSSRWLPRTTTRIWPLARRISKNGSPGDSCGEASQILGHACLSARKTRRPSEAWPCGMAASLEWCRCPRSFNRTVPTAASNH